MNLHERVAYIDLKTTWDHRFDSFPDSERCKICGQPDNCGDCNHYPLSDYEANDLLGIDERSEEWWDV